MTITDVHAGAHPSLAGTQRRATWREQLPRRFEVGEELQLRVLNDLGERRYVVTFAGEQHLVESAMKLQTNGVVHARVVAVGDKLELKYLDSATPASASDTTPSEPAPADTQPLGLVAQLQERYAVDLDSQQRHLLVTAMADVPDPALMASGAMFLSRLSPSWSGADLQAIYAAQSWPAAPVSEQASAQRSSLLGLEAGSGDEARIAVLLQEALETQDSLPSADNDSPPSLDSNVGPAEVPQRQSADPQAQQEDARERALRLLNTQDDSSLSYRYGTLPILVADQLVELDLVYFREREAAGRADGVRRLVMSFATQSLGRVEVMAQAFGSHLNVAITTENHSSREMLAGYGEEVKALVTRMGWNVDAVSYDADADRKRAAGHIVNHVLSSDLLDRLV